MADSKPNILFVDDEEQNLLAFKSAFRRSYTIHLANSAQEGIKILKEQDIEVIITDQRMPEMTGVEFLASVLPEFPEAMRIILTGYSDVGAVIQAINQGEVYRYITKPWDKEELKLTIDNALSIYYLKEENKQLIQKLQEANQDLEDKVKARTLALEKSQIELSEKYDQLAISHQELSERNQMINLLLRELNHRVLNNLQVVSAVVGREAETIEDEDLQEIFKRIDQRINEMARIHQQLMYRNNLGMDVDLLEYFQEITQILAHMYLSPNHPPYIFIETQNILLVQEKAYFLGFIVHELVTNSFKYAYQELENPQLEIYLEEINGAFQLRVQDNGIGLPPELVDGNQIKFELIKSMGLKIINLIAKLHQGAFIVDPDWETGACFQITLSFNEN